MDVPPGGRVGGALHDAVDVRDSGAALAAGLSDLQPSGSRMAPVRTHAFQGRCIGAFHEVRGGGITVDRGGAKLRRGGHPPKGAVTDRDTPGITYVGGEDGKNRQLLWEGWLFATGSCRHAAVALG